MKFLHIYFALVLCFVAKGHSQFLCYQCEGCDVLDDSLLTECPAAIITTPGTTEPPTTSPGSSEPTTSSPGSTESSSSSSTSSSTPSSTSSSTPSSTSSSTPSSTASSSSSSSTTTTTVSPPEGLVGAVESAIIQKLSQNARQSRSLRSILRADPSSHCYSIDTYDGDVLKVIKGCIAVEENEAVCDVLANKHGESSKNCKACETDRCNSSAALKFSFVTFVIAVMISLFVRK